MKFKSIMGMILLKFKKYFKIIIGKYILQILNYESKPCCNCK